MNNFYRFTSIVDFAPFMYRWIMQLWKYYDYWRWNCELIIWELFGMNKLFALKILYRNYILVAYSPIKLLIFTLLLVKFNELIIKLAVEFLNILLDDLKWISLIFVNNIIDLVHFIISFLFFKYYYYFDYLHSIRILSLFINQHLILNVYEFECLINILV